MDPDDAPRIAVEEIALEEIDGHVALLRLDRPAKLNALDGRAATELAAALRTSPARAIVVAGHARAFSVGADLHEDAFGADNPWLATLDELAATPVPTVAAIEGHCLGGGLELALCCDLRVAGEGARFALPEVTRGLFPAGGGTQRLPRLVGLGRAKRLLLTGEAIDAVVAERWGLVDVLAPAGGAEAAAVDLATTLAAGPPLALRAIKALVEEGAHLPLDEALALERSRLAEVATSADAAEGVRAFLERRPPRFEGR